VGFSLNKADIFRFLGKNWVIALILTIPILFFIPYPKKYKTTVKVTGNRAGNKIFYDDINNDGNSERIEIREYTKLRNVPSIFVGENGKVLYEWITTGYIAPYMSSLSGDYDHDGLKEVYLITYENDSIFLNGVIPFRKKVFINRKFITRFKFFHGNNDLSVSDFIMTDLNGDGFQELVLFIYSGFTYTNRKVIAYDIKNDSLLFSPKSGWGLLWNLHLYDWDHDSLPEFTGGFPAWGNCTEPGYPYTDSIAWLMVLDNDLSFMFKPVPIGVYSSEVSVVPFKYGNTVSLAVLYKQNGISDSSFIALYTPVGKLIKKKNFDIPGQKRIFLFSDPDLDYRELYLLGEEIQQFDSSLYVIRTIPIQTGLPINRLDLDGDGKKEYIVGDKANDRFVIYRSSFKDPVNIDISLTGGPLYMSIIKKKNVHPKLFLALLPHTYEITYSLNIIYYFRWLIVLLVYSIMFLFIYIIGKIQHARIQQRFNDERRITELQIKAIRNQIDPHFTLNMVNTIGSLFNRKETDMAYEVFTRYSRLLQSTISSSDNIAISLHKELDYVKNYLAIQQFRMENKFTFNITIAKDLNIRKIKVPKMLVYTFVENAVKHGIGPLKEKGKIDIEVLKKRKTIIIVITDNGIGRKQALEHPALSTGKGLKILDEIIELFFKLENIRIRYELTDGEEGGTVVRIYIPQK